MSNNYDFSLKPQGPDPKNMLVAVLATSMIFMLYSYFFAPIPENITQEEVVNVVESSKPLDIVAEQNPHEKATKSDIAIENINFQHEQEAQRISYDALVSNEGASLKQYNLIDFKNHKIFDERSSFLSLYSRNSHITLHKNTVYEITDKTQNSITLKHVTAEGLEVVRYWQFLPLALIAEEITVKNISAKPLKVELGLDIIKVEEKKPAAGFFNPGVSADSLVLKNNKHEKVTFADLKKQTKEITDFSYIGIDEQFFLMAFIPSQKYISKVQSSVKEIDNLEQLSINFALNSSILMPSEEQKFAHKIFIGPKQVDLLSSITPPLDENIDFGWFGILSRPMLWMLVSINDWVHNYGLAIILITLIIKLLTYPLTKKSFDSQQEMKILAPKIKEIQAKYSHDRTLLGQKQMELYKEHGVNPLAGCLPLFIQFPIWIAFFQMLRNSVELYNQPFFAWITDLTLADPYYILPVLMGISMFIQQYLTPMPQDQPQMKYVMWGMPFFITLVMLNMPAGLSLYSLVNNILTIMQQLLMNKLKSKN